MSDIALSNQLAAAMFKSAQKNQQVGLHRSSAFSPVFDQQRETMSKQDINPAKSSPVPKDSVHVSERRDAVIKKREEPKKPNESVATRERSNDSDSATKSSAKTKDVDGNKEATRAKSNDETDADDVGKVSSKQAENENSNSQHGDDATKGHERAAERLSEKSDKEMPETAHANGLENADEKHAAINFVEEMLAQAQLASEVQSPTDSSDITLETLNADSIQQTVDDTSANQGGNVNSDVLAALLMSKKGDAQSVDPVIGDAQDLSMDKNHPAAQALASKANPDALKALLEKILADDPSIEESMTGNAFPHEMRDAIKSLLKDEGARSDIVKLLDNQSLSQAVNSDDASSTGSNLHPALDALLKKIEQLGGDPAKLAAALDQRAMTHSSVAKAEQASSMLDNVMNKITTDGVTDKASTAGAGNSLTRPQNAQGPVPQYLMADSMDDKDAWGSAFAKRIQFFANNNIQHAELRLDPPELGRVNVRIQLSADQANVTFTAANTQVKDAIEAAIPKLRDMFNESGIQLSQANVSSQFNQQQQSHRDFDREAMRSRHNGYDLGDDENASTNVTATRVYASDRLVDYYA